MAKSRDAFRTISEVSEWLGTPAHVLRFWESKFSQIKPVKRAGGRRYYRPNDMALLSGIKTLLHDQGMTIKGAQKLLRENGIKHVSALGAHPDKSGNRAENAIDITPTLVDTGQSDTAPNANNPWPADPAQESAETTKSETSTSETVDAETVDTAPDEPKKIKVPVLPDEAAALPRPGPLSFVLSVSPGAAQRHSEKLLPMLSRLEHAAKRMAAS